ncbi:MAG TPA: hypothetical protein VFB45_16190 [Pseudolabrys sp.]|nr:hypothetical protein [Pseudolabrys sp.]
MRAISSLVVAAAVTFSVPAFAQAPNLQAQPCPGVPSAAMATTGSGSGLKAEEAYPPGWRASDHAVADAATGGRAEPTAPAAQPSTRGLVASNECPKDVNRLDNPRRQ